MDPQKPTSDARAQANTPLASTLEHAPQTLFQHETTPAPSFPLPAPTLSRRLLFSAVCILIYVLLDRTTVYLQIWPDISAWYPPTGFSVALMIGIGAEMIPTLLVAGYLSGYLNYHQSLTSVPNLLVTPLIIFGYGSASLYLRSKLGPHLRIRSTRDVTNFLGVSLHCSLTAATVGTGILVCSGEVPSAKFFQAAFTWWIGDAVAISSITPFLLEIVLPFCHDFFRVPSLSCSNFALKIPQRAALDFLEAFAFLASIVLLIYLQFFNVLTRDSPFYYLFLLPLLWIALRHGIRGVVISLVVMDSSLAFALHAVHLRPLEMAVLQFFMLVLALTSLLLGAILSERKEVERRLCEEEERIRLLLDSTAEGIYGVDVNNTCTFMNPAALRLLGFSSRDEALGKNLHSQCHHSFPDGAPMPAEACYIYETIRSGHDVHRDDEVFWRQDGSSFPVEYWSHALRREDEIVGCVVTFLDISQRRVFERTVRESEQKFRAVFEGAQIGIAVTDLQNGKVTTNPAYQRMLACSADEMRSLIVFDKLTHPEDHEADRRSLQRLMAGELDHLHADKRYLLPDNRVIWASTEFSVLRDTAGSPQYVLGLAAPANSGFAPSLLMPRSAWRCSIVTSVISLQAAVGSRITALANPISPGFAFTISFPTSPKNGGNPIAAAWLAKSSFSVKMSGFPWMVSSSG